MQQLTYVFLACPPFQLSRRMAAEGGAQRHGEKRAKEAEDEATVPASPEQMQQFALPLGLKPPEHVRKEETTNAGRPHREYLRAQNSYVSHQLRCPAELFLSA